MGNIFPVSHPACTKWQVQTVKMPKYFSDDTLICIITMMVTDTHRALINSTPVRQGAMSHYDLLRHFRTFVNDGLCVTPPHHWFWLSQWSTKLIFDLLHGISLTHHHGIEPILWWIRVLLPSDQTLVDIRSSKMWTSVRLTALFRGPSGFPHISKNNI